MQIDKCTHSRYCGDKSGDNAKDKQVWYCPRRHCCPFGKCEKPAPKIKEIKEMPKIKNIVEPRKYKTKYDWDRTDPIMQQMRNQDKSWKEISLKTGVPVSSLVSRWSKMGMMIN